MSPETIVSAVAANDCRRLRRFLPPRCFRFFAVADGALSGWLSELGFMAGGGFVVDGPPPGALGGYGGLGVIVETYCGDVARALSPGEYCPIGEWRKANKVSVELVEQRRRRRDTSRLRSLELS